jgi:hypothetical protein
MMLASLTGLLDAPDHIQRNTPRGDGPYEALIAQAPAEWVAWVGCELIGRTDANADWSDPEYRVQLVMAVEEAMAKVIASEP